MAFASQKCISQGSFSCVNVCETSDILCVNISEYLRLTRRSGKYLIVDIPSQIIFMTT